mgnify:CR=1 FL=1
MTQVAKVTFHPRTHAGESSRNAALQDNNVIFIVAVVLRDGEPERIAGDGSSSVAGQSKSGHEGHGKTRDQKQEEQAELERRADGVGKLGPGGVNGSEGGFEHEWRSTIATSFEARGAHVGAFGGGVGGRAKFQKPAISVAFGANGSPRFEAECGHARKREKGGNAGNHAPDAKSRAPSTTRHDSLPWA